MNPFTTVWTTFEEARAVYDVVISHALPRSIVMIEIVEDVETSCNQCGSDSMTSFNVNENYCYHCGNSNEVLGYRLGVSYLQDLSDAKEEKNDREARKEFYDKIVGLFLA
jgi:ribosomal protein L37AE/L43A